jgi:Undecaprenyl-phosphate galactose phosphotransferase WbaP
MTQRSASWGTEYLPTDRSFAGLVAPCMLVVTDIIMAEIAVLLGGTLAWLGSIKLPLYSVLTETQLVWPSTSWPQVVALIWLLTHFGGRGHYTSRVTFWNEVGTVIGATAIGFAIDAILNILVSGQRMEPYDVIVWLLFVPTLLAGRQATRALLNLCGCWTLRTVIIGEPSVAASAIDALRSEPALGYEVVGSIDMANVGDPDPQGSWLDVLRSYNAEFVIVALGGGKVVQESIVTSTLMRLRISFAAMPNLGGLPVIGFNQDYFFSQDVLLLAMRNVVARPLKRVIKIAFDKAAALLLLLLLTPLLLVIASIVRTDRGPALFAHRRIGANGRRFSCLKFRTMVKDADRVLRRVLETDPAARAEWEATQKLRMDPRVTSIGRFLRDTSLDELPQLINVLRGEMSLVGPRPIVEAEIVRYGRDIDHYYDARPGMTGLWQVSGRSDTSYQRRVQLDVWYVKNWSLWHDIAILLKTIPAVLSKDGAV